MEDYSEYLNYLILLDINSSEFKLLINSLTINETFFFRHPSHFILLRDFLFNEICRYNQKLKKPRKVFRIWSAGCSNGSETYSIAILIFEAFSYIKSCGGFDKIEIIGSDIDSNIISKAENGIYDDRCVKTSMPAEYLNKYFYSANGMYKIKDEIKNIVTFRKLNLVKDIYPIEVHFVFCRNVLYYFNLKMQKQILKKIYNSLNNNGYLFLGGTESLSLNYEEYFESCNFMESFYYRKWSTDRRQDGDIKYMNKRFKPSHKWEEPKIKIDTKNNSIKFEGVFAENCDAEKLQQNCYYSFGLFDNEKMGIKIFDRIYKNIFLDFSNIRWISNDVLSEIKNCINFFKSKNVKISIIFGDNEDIYKWLKKSNFNQMCNIDKGNELKLYNSNIDIMQFR